MIEKSLTAPRKKKVKGQLHKLAYITPKEAKLLQKFGGQKVMTPEKIPAYPPPGERGGPGSGAEGRAPSGEGRGEYRSPPPAPKPEPRVSPIQSIAMTGDISLAGKTQDEAQASVDRDNKLEQMKMAKRGLMKPVLLPTPKKRTVYKTSDTGPFKKDGRDYQDKIRQTKREIEFDPNLSNEEKVEKNQILDDFVYKGAFVAEPKTYGIKNLLTDALLFGSGVGFLGKGAQTGARLLSGAKRGQQLAELVKPGITKELLDTVKFSGNVNRRTPSIATGGQGEGAQQVVSGGGDVVTQKIKEFTGEKETQQTDSKQSQLLLMLKKLQEYDSQNRLNDRGKQYLAQLMSFMNQPLPGRSRDI